MIKSKKVVVVMDSATKAPTMHRARYRISVARDPLISRRVTDLEVISDFKRKIAAMRSSGWNLKRNRLETPFLPTKKN